MTLIQRLIPLNLEIEKKKFFFDPNYNPQFTYVDEVAKSELQKYTKISDEYLSVANKIIETVKEGGDSPANTEQKEKEPFLTKEQVEKVISDFLLQENLSKAITLRFSNSAIARTSMYQNTLIIRTPVEYTHQGLIGMLYHEIGTHQFRSMNDRKQIWRGKQDQIKLHPYFTTEEGLAVLHAQIPKESKLLVYQAINYIAVEFANTHSFSQTYEMLKKYVAERERRFDICVRVKRGIKDTSQKGAFPKDQIYLKGAIHVWHWLKDHNFDPTDLYIGKIALEDIDSVKSLSKSEPLLLPTFITRNHEEYRQSLMEIGRANGFEKL